MNLKKQIIDDFKETFLINYHQLILFIIWFILKFDIYFLIKKNKCGNKKLKLEIKNDELFDLLLRIKENFHLDLDIPNFDNQ